MKTGAADSTWVRDVLAEANSTTEFHLVTADSDPDSVFRAMGLRPPRIHKSLRELRKALFRYDDTRVLHVVAEILDFLNDEDVWDDRIRIREPELDGRIASEVPESVVQLEVFPVMPFKVVGVTDVLITKMRGTVSARVALAATFELGGWTLNADGALAHTFSATYDGGVLVADFVFDRHDGELIGATADDIVIAHGRHDRYDTVEDAKHEVMQLLVDLVPDVATVDDPESVTGEQMIATTMADIGIELRETAKGWELTVLDRTDGSECVVSCGYDDCAFVGGSSEGEHMEPPYVLSAASDDASLGRPMWAANAFLLDRIRRNPMVV